MKHHVTFVMWMTFTLTCVALAAPPNDRAQSTTVPAAEPDAAATFEQRAAELAAQLEANDAAVHEGADGWLFFRNELRHLGVGKFWSEAAAEASKAPRPEWADPIPAIVDFQAQCEEAGVELLFVPVPAKAVIYPDKLDGNAISSFTSDKPGRLDKSHQQFIDALRAKGVNVLDLTPRFLQARGDGGNARLYCKTDTHFSPQACALTAEWIFQRYQNESWVQRIDRTEFDTETRELTITGDLARMRDETEPAQETLNATFVGEQRDGALQPLNDDRDSPILLLGDSHTLVFHNGGDLHARGAGLADHLAHQFGTTIDVIGVRGSGATPSRIRLLRRGGNLEGKKLLIWCLSVREYTEGQGWRKVPIVR